MSPTPSTSASPSTKIRRQFLDFFRERGHVEVASSSLVPSQDPTLLFTNAGMVQFKDVFTGQTRRPEKRATSSQKCVRAGGKHNDLENVGRTARHHTFFEMLGNFSFGDYFKTDAITFAFDLLTRTYAIDPRRLIYTVHESDDEAHALWKKIAGVPDDRVVRLGDKDNFWAMGDTGPCGPCSEIHYHQGDDIPCPEVAAARSCLGPACDCDRWVEIWNLVFMQFEQVSKTERRPLPRPSVDTGMGLERLCAVLEGVRSNYETDLIRPLIDRVVALSGKTFVPADYSGASASIRAIADHARATAFLIADGVFPDKTGRAYVLRRIMRRAVYHGWLLGIHEAFLAGLTEHVIEGMSPIYPELAERRGLIHEVAEQEERRFRETLDRGLRILDQEMAGPASPRRVSGPLAFKLYDTFGFPLDLTRVIADGRQWELDAAGFDAAMNEQRRRSEFHGSGETAVDSVYRALAEEAGPTEFVGYQSLRATSVVKAIVQGGRSVREAHPGGEAAEIAVVVAQTPFYGEQGGQVGDTGTITTTVAMPGAAAALLTVTDVQRPLPTLHVHHGRLSGGPLRVGDAVDLVVDEQHRSATRRNHSATHLLHWALRSVLGDHVAQKGSRVAPDRLRFDFSHFAPLTKDERRRVEDMVNEAVRANVPTGTDLLAIAEAKKSGAIAFFGEKYGDTVRVVTLGDSKELCGGTHVARTGDIALVKITEETGIAQGVRRIEAVTGGGAIDYVQRLQSELEASAEALRTTPFAVANRVDRLQGELRERDREIEQLKRRLAAGSGRDLAAEATEVNGVKVLATRADVADPKSLREVADQLRNKLRSGVIVLAGVEGDKVALVAMVTPDLTDRFSAGTIVADLARELGGKGGGRPDMAQGGGAHPERLDAALARVRELVRG
jgi:alanyl-tRNA synthetase